MALRAAEIESVLKLPGAKRYDYFVKRVADWGEVWGLWSDGWALAGTEGGKRVFPLWPAPEYAERCASGVWQGYAPERIGVHSLVEELLPKLRADGVVPGIFYTPSDRGVLADINQLTGDLRQELDKIE